MFIRVRRAIALACTVLVLIFFYSSRSTTQRDPVTDLPASTQTSRKQQIVKAFDHAWQGYSKHCFAYDTLHPVSNTCEDDFGGWGATALDSLSTAIMLGRESVVLEILGFISTLDFTLVQGGSRIQVFEVVIRHFAGLVSGWDLLNGPFSHMAKDQALRESLYKQMVRLGDILSCAFDTPSGIPREWLDPLSCMTDDGTRNTVAGAGTIILEFARLSDITLDNKYVKLAEKAESYLLRPEPVTFEPWPGIIGSHVNVSDGKLVDWKGSWGAASDSFYEYLIKAYVYDSDRYGLYLERWLLAADSTIRSIGSHPFGHPEWTLLPYWQGQKLSNDMDSLSWFAGGNFILGGMVTNNQTLVNYGLSIADTAGAVYSMSTTGLGGEYVAWRIACGSGPNAACDAQTSLYITDPSFRLRPEVLETWYYAYRATRHPKYREWAWAAFEAMNTVCRTSSGFSAITNVNETNGGTKTDLQETFVFAEVMKYVYLIHLEDQDAPFHVQDSRTGLKNTWVYNTEAHPLRVAGPPR